MTAKFTSSRSQILSRAETTALQNRLLAYAHPERNGWYLAIVSIFVSTLASSIALRLIAPLIDTKNDLNATLIMLGIMLALTVSATLLMRYARALMAQLAQKMVVNLRTDYHESLMQQDLAFYRAHEVGQLTSTGMNDVEVVSVFFTQQVPFLLVNVGQFILALVFMFILDWRLTLLSLVVVGLLNWLSTVFIVPSMQRLGSEYRAQFAQVNGRLTENLTGVRDIQIFTQEERRTNEFRIWLNNLAEYMVRNMNLTASFVAVFYLLSGLGPVLIFGAGALDLLPAGQVVSFYTFFAQFISPLTAFSNALVSIQGMLVAAQRIFKIMDLEPLVQEKPEAINVGNLKGHIKFENVAFCYTPENPESWRVKNVTLEIMPGEKVAFVGGSGSGKSTLLNLVTRFYDATAGRVTIDGYDVRDLQLKSLRQNFGMVAQNAMLFHGTLLENIRFGKPQATFEQVQAAAEVGGVVEFLDKLEHGYDTELGEFGQGLSGGQKQRVAIARAALMNPAIYIFDEATSALDAETERTVAHALDKTSRGRTTLVIAHRLNTIINSDKIIFMSTDDQKHGIIKAVGTHEELLKTCEEYAVLYGMKSRTKSILMPISPLYNTLPLLPTVVGLARSYNAPVYVIDLGVMELADLTENRIGVETSMVELDATQIAELNFAHGQRIRGIESLMTGENVKCEIIHPKARANWIDLLIQAIDTVEATHVVIMDHFLIPFELLQATVRNVSRKMDVEIILVDPTVGMKNIYEFGEAAPLPAPIIKVTPPTKRWRTALITLLPIVWVALVLLLGYPALINAGIQNLAALSLAAALSAVGYVVGLWAMRKNRS